MIARVWGARGSLATPGPGTISHGGNTSCLELTLEDGTTVVLDAGTGIRMLGVQLAGREPGEIHLLLTHLHMDHVEGLVFFAPLWTPGWHVHLWGPRSTTATLRERFARHLTPPLFAVEVTDAPTTVEFHDVPEGEWRVGSARFRAQPVEHPGPTVGYRVEDAGRTLVYLPDHEPYLGIDDPGSVEPGWLSGWALAAGADVLLHDAQYTEAEYPDRVGWWHSSIAHAVAFAQAARVGRLVLFHHDPMHDDDELLALHDRAKELWNGRGAAPLIAYEGMELRLEAGGEGAAPAPSPSDEYS